MPDDLVASAERINELKVERDRAIELYASASDAQVAANVEELDWQS